MKITKNKNVLVLGASIAGLSIAWWLNHIGYRVTVVELAAVDLNGDSVAIAKRMGLYEKLKSHQLGVDRIEYKNADDFTEGTIIMDHGAEPQEEEEIEIEREKFVEVLVQELSGHIEFMFNNSIVEIEETENSLNVAFKRGEPRIFGLVFGCDGSHSGTRKLWFGPEKEYAHFLGAYFSISTVNELLLPQRFMQTFSVPYKTVMLNGYNGKTDIVFIFLSDEEICYNYRDIDGQRQIIKEHFTGQKWPTTELLEKIEQSESFYFDKFCQIKMPAWSKGRVTLLGDAAYCPSPASGQGGSLAFQGAAAIADALLKHHGNHEFAFKDYEETMRPKIEEIQISAEENVKTNFVLKTESEIRKRNTEAKLF